MQFIEKHSIKIQLGVAVSVLVIIIGFTSQVGAKLKENDLTHDTLSKTVQLNSDDITDLQLKAQASEVAMMEIKTKLANIEAMTLEIKQRLNK